jgi:hypothetical protein
MNNHILISSLYDIHAKIEQLNKKYGDRVYLEALTDIPLPDKSAPKAAVYGFLSFLSEQLLQQQNARDLLNSEKNMKNTITIILFTMFIVFSAIVLGFGSYLFIKKIINVDNMFDRIRYGYFVILITFVSAMSLIIGVFIFKNKMEITKQSYQIDSMFKNEPAIHHLMNMQRLTDRSLKSYKVKGCTPLMGFFLKKNRLQDVKYTFTSDDWPKTGALYNCLDKNKVFNFNERSSRVHLRDLIQDDNIPCAATLPGTKYHAVDPLFPGTVYKESPVFLKKIEKYDNIKQSQTLQSSIDYFEKFMLGNDVFYEENLSGQEAFREKILASLSGCIIRHDLILSFTNVPYQNMNYDTFLSILLDDTVSVCAYYDPSESKAYFFTDASDLTLIYYSQDSVRETPTFFARPYDNHHIKIGTDNAEVKEMFMQAASFGKKLSKKKVYLYDSNGNVYTTTDLGVTYKDVLEPWNERDDIKWFYSTTLENFVSHVTDSTSLSDTYITLKDAIVKHLKITAKNMNVEPDYSFMSSLYPTKQYNWIESIMCDILNDTATEVLKDNDNTNEEEEDKSPYISYDGFVKALSNMKQKEFVNEFMKHLDNLSSSSNGLHVLNTKYMARYQIQKNNILIFDFIVILISVAGGAETFRYCIESYLHFMCRQINYNDQKYQVSQKYMTRDDEKPSERRRKTSTIKMLHQEINGKQGDDKTNTIFKLVIIVSGVLMGISMMFAWKIRSRTTSTMNRYKMEHNTMKIINNSQSLFNQMIDNVTKDGYFVSTSSGFEDTGDQDQLYHDFTRIAHVDEDKNVFVPSHVNFLHQYQNLKSILSSYKACNSLVSDNMNKTPFPMFEFSLYLMVLGVIVIAFIYMFYQINPLDMIKKMNTWSKIEELQKLNIEVDPASYDIICNNLEAEKNKKIISHMSLMLLALVIFAVSLVFAIYLLKNSSVSMSY